jgi:predicted AlkP superfamily pyrophosphatase or phosphodiesterase
MKRLLVVLLLSAGLASLVSCASPHRATGPRSDLLVLISIDGYRWDYLLKHPTPNLQRLAAGGVHAKRMTPSFPSLTFPNHYTLVTGLYPEHHGIVANTFYDPALQASFAYKTHESSVDPRWWAGGEPVWITAEKQGVRSACFFWPGSEAENHGMRPTYYKTFSKQLSCNDRVDGLLEWIKLPPAQRPHFATLYFDVVDTKGHDFGPESAEVASAIQEVDAAIGRLIDGLDQLGYRGRTDLVIVSDHGMEPVSPDRVVFFDDYADLKSFTLDFAGPVAGLRPKNESPEEMAARFRGKHPELDVWLRSEVPERLHYRASDRIAPVILSTKPGWVLGSHEWLRFKRATFERGSHGFDPATPNMGALFIAHGPSFKRNHEFADVENIQVYNLLCATLGVKPAKNDGDDRLVKEALKP